jgi:hypothetical protein
MPPRKPKPNKHPQLNPWDIRPPPAQGDSSSEKLYTAVGHALTRWEELEEHLADLFAIFVGSSEITPGKTPAIRAYGSVSNFYGRADMLEAAGEAFFSIHEAKRDAGVTGKAFSGLMKDCKRFCSRRNDIAHGRKHHIPRKGHYLFPAFYNSKKYPLPANAAVSYSFTSTEIDYYADRFADLATRAERLWGPTSRIAG